jgi:hypothetical protein
MQPAPTSMTVGHSVLLNAAFKWLVDDWLVAIELAFAFQFFQFTPHNEEFLSKLVKCKFVSSKTIDLSQ